MKQENVMENMELWTTKMVDGMEKGTQMFLQMHKQSTDATRSAVNAAFDSYENLLQEGTGQLLEGTQKAVDAIKSICNQNVQ